MRSSTSSAASRTRTSSTSWARRSRPRPRDHQHRARPGRSRERGEAARQDRPHGQVRRAAGQARAPGAGAGARRAGRRPPGAVVVRPTRRNRRPTGSFNLLTAKPVLYAANVAEAESRPATRTSRRCAPRSRAKRARRGRSLLRQGRGRAGGAGARGPGGVPRVARPHRVRARPPRPRGVPPARPAELLHRGREGSAGVDHPPRRHARRPPPASFIRTSSTASFEPRPSATTTSSASGAGSRPGSRARPGRGQGVRGAGRRRHAVPLQRLRGGRSGRGPTDIPRSRIYFPAHKPSSSAPTPARGDLDRRKVS